MIIDILLAVGAGLLLLIGFLGTFVPVIPGAPLAWAGLLLAFFSNLCNISLPVLIICAVAAVFVSVLDNIFRCLQLKNLAEAKQAQSAQRSALLQGLLSGQSALSQGLLPAHLSES